MKLKKKVRRLERRVDLLQDALNDLTDRWLGVSPTAHLAVVEDDPVYVVECPLCKADLLPVNQEGVLVLPRHQRTYEGSSENVFCTGTALPVSNTDKELKGD